MVSVLGLGGIWNADVVPGSRCGVLVPLVAVLLVAGGGYGCWRLAPAWGPGAGARAGRARRRRPACSRWPATRARPRTPALRWLVAHVPGAGLLRDGQKWAAWWALPAALGCALAVERPPAGCRPRPAAVLAGAALLPLALLPDLAWGGARPAGTGRLPAGLVRRARRSSTADTHRGDVLVLPFQPFRQFGWNDGRTQFDPAPRFLPRAGDRRRHARGRRAGDPRRGPAGGEAAARRHRRSRRAGRLGLGWVLVEHGTPGEVPAAALPG